MIYLGGAVFALRHLGIEEDVHDSFCNSAS